MSKQGTSSGRVFQLIGGSPALDFINALDWRFRKSGPEELLTSYEDLLQFASQSGLLASQLMRQLSSTVKGSAAQGSLTRAKELRETLASIVYDSLDGKTPPAKTVGTLEHFFREASSRRSLVWRHPRLTWDWSGSESNPDLPVWTLSLNAAELMSSETVSKITACKNIECRWLFLDMSKNHTRRWCDMKLCGNRMKARRFKASRT